MIWTDDIPTESGSYWIKDGDNTKIKPIEIRSSGFLVGSPGKAFCNNVPLESLDFQYSGPIEEPCSDLVGCFDRLLEKIDKLREEVVLIKDFYSEMEERHFES